MQAGEQESPVLKGASQGSTCAAESAKSTTRQALKGASLGSTCAAEKYCGCNNLGRISPAQSAPFACSLAALRWPSWGPACSMLAHPPVQQFLHHEPKPPSGCAMTFTPSPLKALLPPHTATHTSHLLHSKHLIVHPKVWLDAGIDCPPKFSELLLPRQLAMERGGSGMAMKRTYP